MEKSDNLAAYNFLQNLVGQPLCYGLKFPDFDLYDFGFGDCTEVKDWKGDLRKISTYVLHISCGFKVIWRKNKRCVKQYYGDTPHEKFYADIQSLLGLTVRRVALSDKNDLWIDFDNCWVVFVTIEDGEESWRFFSQHPDERHLVASDLRLEF